MRETMKMALICLVALQIALAQGEDVHGTLPLCEPMPLPDVTKIPPAFLPTDQHVSWEGSMIVKFTITEKGRVVDATSTVPDDMPEKLRRWLPKMTISHVTTFRYPARQAACRGQIVVRFPDPYAKAA